MKQEFGYFLKNAKFRAALGLTLLLSYGYAIATTRVSIDSLEGDRYIGTGGVMLSTGRFGMNLWAAVLGYGRAEPSYAFGIDLLAALLLALAAAVLLHVGIIVVVNLLGHALHLDAVEKASMIYSNAGNLIIPIVTAVLGKEWVIYSSAFLSVQLFLLWSHAKSMLCGEKSFELKKVLTNINMIAILAGAALFLLHIQLPAVIEDSLDMVGSAIGPISMIILGMLMAGMNFKKILGYRRLWLVTALRLVGIPLAAVALLKLSGLAHLVPDGQTILLVSLLATCTPSASTITQMAQIYGKDADYASAINVVTTLLCIFTMPLMVALYQL